MKRISIIIISLFLPFSTFASQIELKISSTYNKGVTTTKMNEINIKTILGKEFIIPVGKDNPFQLKLKASIDAHKAVTIKGKISLLEGANMKLVSSPKIITMLGKEAIISTKDTNNEYFELKILPVKIYETAIEKKQRTSSIKRLPVYTKSIFSVSYQPIEKIKNQLKKLLSKKGHIDIDLRTNSLIVKDTLKNMILINAKFNSIDI